MLRIKLNLFLSPCQKLRLFETICNLQLIWQFGHILPVFYPYLEFSARLSLVISASLKYIVDNRCCLVVFHRCNTRNAPKPRGVLPHQVLPRIQKRHINFTIPVANIPTFHSHLMYSNSPQIAPKKSGMSSDHVKTFFTSVLRSLRSGLEKPDFLKSKWGLMETFGD